MVVVVAITRARIVSCSFQGCQDRERGDKRRKTRTGGETNRSSFMIGSLVIQQGGTGNLPQ